MQIIPVIDLKDGLVVHAVKGDRANYRPIHRYSCLTDSSDIEAVLAGFLNLHPFKRFYIADLDAITGTGNHHALIARLLADFPAIEFWVDSGARLADITPGTSRKKWVVGTESQPGMPEASEHDYILSLDYKNGRQAGHPAWFEQADLWPQTVIAMTLSRVGSHAGPDLAKLAELGRLAPDKCWVAAGGVRHAEDLASLRQMGVSAVLVASALHGGNISASDL